MHQNGLRRWFEMNELGNLLGGMGLTDVGVRPLGETVLKWTVMAGVRASGVGTDGGSGPLYFAPVLNRLRNWSTSARLAPPSSPSAAMSSEGRCFLLS